MDVSRETTVIERVLRKRVRAWRAAPKTEERQAYPGAEIRPERTSRPSRHLAAFRTIVVRDGRSRHFGASGRIGPITRLDWFRGTGAVVLLSLAFCLALTTRRAWAQEAADFSPVLTLDRAVEIATSHNRQARMARLEIDKSKLDVAAAKTQRLPAFQTNVFASALITPVRFTFPEGTFGTYPGIGPIPASQARITTPAGTLSAYTVSQVVQPLSQLYKLHLGIREKELVTDSDRQKYRATEQEIVENVKQTYYGILQAESELRSTAASVKQYRELDRVVRNRISQHAALESDCLEVEAKLAEAQYKMLQFRDQLQARKEYLNYLIGRDITTPFQTQHVPPMSPGESSLQAAQRIALAQRPELRQAKIGLQKAVYDRRLAKADYIPNVGLAVRYLSPFNIQFVPKNIASVGLELTLNPFQWGRRKDEVQGKELLIEQSRLRLKDTRAQVLLDVDNHFRSLREARALLKVADAARKAAAEKLQEVTKKYGQRSVLLRDVLQQQAEAASANSAYEQALLSFWTAKAEFEKALGEQ